MNNQDDEAFVSENDADLFASEKSHSDNEEKEENGNSHQILEAFRQNVLAKPINEQPEGWKWHEFKENDGVSKMLERKIEQQKKEDLKKELEQKKNLRKIMKTPVEYINFLKTFLLVSLYRLNKFSQKMFSELLQAYLLSKLSVEDLQLIEKIGNTYQSRKNPMDFIVRDLFRVFAKYFVFKKFNTYYLLYNLAVTNTYTHEQMTWLFAALCQYLKIPVRFVSIVDLTSFNLDRKYKVTMKSIQENASGRKNPKKRKIIEDSNEINLNASNNTKRRKNEPNLIDKCIKSLLEKGTSNENIPEDKNFDSSAEDAEEKSEKLAEIDLDNFLLDFQFKKPQRTTQNRELPTSLKKKLPSNLDEVFSELLDINSYHFGNKSFNEKNKERAKNIISDTYDSDEYKYWLELYDFELKRWIVINPIHQELYKEVFPKYIQAKIHNIPALFILSSIKPTGSLHYLAPNYIFGNSGIFHSDVTIRYSEKWTKTLIHRRQLTLKFWWDEDVMKKIDIAKVLKPSFLYKEVFDSESQLYLEIFKSDIPNSYNEFRNSPYYILPSHLKKFQGLRPAATPIPEMVFKDEPVYLRSDAVDLHTKSKWRQLGRKVKQGEQGIKKVLALTNNDGEQMVDLYGEWQTEEYIVQINEDGTLPRNEYGNYELFNGGLEKLPAGTMHLDLPYISKLCKKYEIEYIDTVIGFEKKGGKSHPVKEGVIIFERDKEKVLRLYEDYAKELFEKESQKEKKKVILIWKKLLKSLLIKRYIKENYENM